MSLTIKLLKQYCAPLAGDLAARGVPQAVREADKPGGENNPRRDAVAWLKYYGALRVIRSELREEGVRGSADAIAAADRLILEALAATPIRVTLAGQSVDGLLAHPKSCLALLKVHVRNLVIRELLRFVGGLQESDDPNALALIEDALTEVLYQHRVVCWIACTDGPGLPFPESEPAPELPERFATLSSLAIPAICQAFDAANGARLQALEYLIAPDEEKGDSERRRPSWSQFLANIAGDKESAEDVMRNRALVSVFAQTQLVASTHREAMAESKRRSEERD